MAMKLLACVCLSTLSLARADYVTQYLYRDTRCGSLLRTNKVTCASPGERSSAKDRNTRQTRHDTPRSAPPSVTLAEMRRVSSLRVPLPFLGSSSGALGSTSAALEMRSMCGVSSCSASATPPSFRARCRHRNRSERVRPVSKHDATAAIAANVFFQFPSTMPLPLHEFAIAPNVPGRAPGGGDSGGCSPLVLVFERRPFCALCAFCVAAAALSISSANNRCYVHSGGSVKFRFVRTSVSSYSRSYSSLNSNSNLNSNSYSYGRGSGSNGVSYSRVSTNNIYGSNNNNGISGSASTTGTYYVSPNAAAAGGMSIIAIFCVLLGASSSDA